jgi:hypothetical protein
MVHPHAVMKKDHPRRQWWKRVFRKIVPHGGTSQEIAAIHSLGKRGLNGFDLKLGAPA